MEYLGDSTGQSHRVEDRQFVRIACSYVYELLVPVQAQFSVTIPKMTKTFKVAKVSELKDGQMKEVEIPGTERKILLSRVKGSFYATGSRCTRKLLLYLQELIGVDYGAPLKNGVLTNSGRLVCPWHGLTS